MLDYLSRNQQATAPNLTVLYDATFASSERFASQLLKPFLEEIFHHTSTAWRGYFTVEFKSEWLEEVFSCFILVMLRRKSAVQTIYNSVLLCKKCTVFSLTNNRAVTRHLACHWKINLWLLDLGREISYLRRAFSYNTDIVFCHQLHICQILSEVWYQHFVQPDAVIKSVTLDIESGIFNFLVLWMVQARSRAFRLKTVYLPLYLGP